MINLWSNYDLWNVLKSNCASRHTKLSRLNASQVYFKQYSSKLTLPNIHLQKKRPESKLHRKYVLNLLNEPQHLAKLKTPKLLKFPRKGVTNLRERKLKNN